MPRDAPSADQAIATGAAVHCFRRNELPLFAVTSAWPAHEEMPPLDVTATLFDGGASVWREPVVFDLVDGSVERPKPVGAGKQVRFKLANHVKVVAEAAALAPYVKSLQPEAAPSASGASSQADHE